MAKETQTVETGDAGSGVVGLQRRVMLHHGDALDVLKALPSNHVDAVLTDPPYCSGGRNQAAARGTISRAGGRPDAEWFLGDNMGTDSYLWFMRELARECFRVTTEGSQAFVFTDWRIYSTVVTAWESAGWTLKSVIVWDKAKGGAMGSFWRNNHEWIPVFVKGKNRPLPHGGFFNTWTGTKPQGGEHPTEKPLGLIRYLVSSVTPEGGTILDPFMGSGTTGVAAVSEGFRFVGVEMHERFIEIARARIEAAASAPGLFDAA